MDDCFCSVLLLVLTHFPLSINSSTLNVCGLYIGVVFFNCTVITPGKGILSHMFVALTGIGLGAAPMPTRVPAAGAHCYCLLVA